ncbi:MAG: hypothetical protein HYW23_01845 [Candidatus Aenigmarchaeota archaeon]|nr:hypothetical protein [Candidatus Aenigmarchaeota archaeon]
MSKLGIILSILILFFVLVVPVHATHQIQYRAPDSITSTVGQPTSLQVDIKNAEASPDTYFIYITSLLPNEIQITNNNITTQVLNPGDMVTISTNVRTLTESDNIITFQVYRSGDSSHYIPITIPVKSKKFSLPDFGLAGFLQIAALATVIFLLVSPKKNLISRITN